MIPFSYVLVENGGRYQDLYLNWKIKYDLQTVYGSILCFLRVKYFPIFITYLPIFI